MADEEVFYKQTTLPTFESEKSQMPEIPPVIGPYKIEALLNKGGMSLLYLGLHPETKEPIAIKVLSPEFVNHPEMLERFLWEAKIIALSNHPNIVKLYGQGEWESGLYIAMEFIRGISLKQFLMQQSFSLKRSLEIVLQIAYALCHLHTHGVIHRDLKPENILIAEDGEVKVIDFGIAQVHDQPETKKRMGSSKQIMGTPSYMSPEQKEDPSSVTFASDIYSLGVITYELVLGKVSYGVINLSLLPTGLQKIVSKALAISVKERYQEVVDFISDLSNYLKSPEIEKERPGADQVKELLEILQQSNINLSPSQSPGWNFCEMGIVRSRTLGEWGLYFDFFKLANQTYLILSAQTSSLSPSTSLLFSANLRGMVRTLLEDYVKDPKKILTLTSLLQKINALVSQDALKETFSLTALLLDPYRGTLSFTRCGHLGGLIHIPHASSNARHLLIDLPLIGAGPAPIFEEIKDNWEEGDLIFLHSLPIKTQDESISTLLLDTIKENRLLSPQRSAEAVMKKLSSSGEFELIKTPKLMISLLRVG